MRISDPADPVDPIRDRRLTIAPVDQCEFS
jgi:hypothetical protein